MPTPAQLDFLNDTARALQRAGAGERGRIAERSAVTLGISVNTLYTWLKTHTGWRSGKKPREGKGETCVPEALARKVAGMMLRATRVHGKQAMTIKLAVENLRVQGEGVVNPETGEVTMPSVDTVIRAMRQYGCHPDQLSTGGATGRVRSLHPNHVWQLDASVCVLYYIRGTKRVGLMDETKFNERKPANLAKIKDKRVVRYVVADHTSNAFYVHYEQAAGEDARGVLNALIGAIEDRGPRDPMHGAPYILYTDQGSANRSSLVLDFCKQLGIKAIQHAPKAANATGSVEQCQNTVEREFEGRMRFMEVPDLAFLQEQADRWRRHYCATAIHTRHNKTRNTAWISIPADKLRTVERGVMEAIAAWGEVTRQVGSDFTISVDTRSHGVRRYDLRELGHHGLNVKDTVAVSLNPYKAPAIIVVKTQPDGSELRFEVAPMEMDAYGQDLNAPVFGESYKAMPDTRSDTILKEIKKEMYGTDSLEEAEKAFKAGKLPSARFDIMADVKEAPLYLRQTGTPLAVAAPATHIPPINRIAFAAMMRREHPEAWNDTTTRECMSWLAERYPDVVPGDKIETVIGQIRERFEPKRAARLTFSQPSGSTACAN